MYLIRIVYKAQIGYLTQAYETGVGEAMQFCGDWFTKIAGFDTSWDLDIL